MYSLYSYIKMYKTIRNAIVNGSLNAKYIISDSLRNDNLTVNDIHSSNLNCDNILIKIFL